MSYLDVRNEVANYSLEFRRFERKNTVLVIYSMIENRKEAINNSKEQNTNEAFQG